MSFKRTIAHKRLNSSLWKTRSARVYISVTNNRQGYVRNCSAPVTATYFTLPARASRTFIRKSVFYWRFSIKNISKTREKSSVKSGINKTSCVACIVPCEKFDIKYRFVISHKRREKKLAILHKRTRNTTAVAEKEREKKSKKGNLKSWITVSWITVSVCVGSVACSYFKVYTGISIYVSTWWLSVVYKYICYM